MTIDTYHKYLQFMAGETTRAMSDPTDDVLVRLTAEFNSFKAKCLASELPALVRQEIAGVHVDYSSARTTRSTWLIIAGVLSLGVIALFLYYGRRSERKEYLRDLKTHLEALAMRTSMRDR